MTRAFILLWLVAFPLVAEIIPTTNRIDWLPGVHGGIPYFTNGVSVTTYGAVGDGTTDDYEAFRDAVAATPPFSAVTVPAGKYRLTNQIQMRTNMVLRGEGAASIILSYNAYSSSFRAAFQFLGSGGTTYRITNYSIAKGDTSLVLSNATGFTVPSWIMLQQNDDPDVMLGAFFSSTNNLQQIAIATNISGNTITLDRPVYGNYSPQFSPTCRVLNMLTNSGLENLTIEGKTNSIYSTWFWRAANCWLTNVHSTNVNLTGSATHFEVNNSARISIVGSKAERNGYSSYVNVYGGSLNSGATDCLVEDNIFDRLWHGFLVQNGAAGNVVAYNFGLNYGHGSDYPTDSSVKPGGVSHGNYPNMNLFEGNVLSYYMQDSFWGNSGPTTVFRNWLRRYSLSSNGSIAPDGEVAISVEGSNYWSSFVGNIVGMPYMLGGTNNWNLGVTTGRAQDYDPYVITNNLFHGNFDFETNGVAWDADTPDQDLPDSFYLAAKPAWFGSLAWPAIGPDVNTNNTITNSAVIPAQARFLGQNYTTIFVTNSARSTRLRGWRGF